MSIERPLSTKGAQESGTKAALQQSLHILEAGAESPNPTFQQRDTAEFNPNLLRGSYRNTLGKEPSDANMTGDDNESNTEFVVQSGKSGVEIEIDFASIVR